MDRLKGRAGGKGGTGTPGGMGLVNDETVQNLRHHSLVAWQRADQLFIKVHLLTRKSFPNFERYELGSQLRRAAYSVPANIVEGFARRYPRERLHFLNIAEGSLAEVAYCIHVAHRLDYITGETERKLTVDLNGVGAPLAGLVRAIRAGTALIT